MIFYYFLLNYISMDNIIYLHSEHYMIKFMKLMKFNDIIRENLILYKFFFSFKDLYDIFKDTKTKFKKELSDNNKKIIELNFKKIHNFLILSIDYKYDSKICYLYYYILFEFYDKFMAPNFKKTKYVIPYDCIIHWKSIIKKDTQTDKITEFIKNNINDKDNIYCLKKNYFINKFKRHTLSIGKILVNYNKIMENNNM